MMTKNENIFELNSLSIGYRRGGRDYSLLPSLSTFAGRGELIALIGQNGIGKSTLLRTITGLQDALGGEVIIKGENLKDISRHELAGLIGYISTEQVRVANMTVYDLVSLGRYPHTGWSGKLNEDDHRIVNEAIVKVGLEDLRNRFINELSDGERQRSMIARVLAQDAEILVMDEPTAFLDVRSKYEIIHLLHDLTRTGKKTIIFSTHDLLTAISESDRVWLAMKDEFSDGAPEDLILAGNFERLFDSSVVKFSPSDASFSFSRQMRGYVNIEATGLERYWTERAANRAGFGLSHDHSGITISVDADNSGRRWLVKYDSGTSEFKSIYDLIKWLNIKALS